MTLTTTNSRLYTKNIQKQYNLDKLSKTTRTEYSKIGKGTPDFSRIDNVIGNIDRAAVVEIKGSVVMIQYNTRSGKNISHSMIYEINKTSLTDKQLEAVESRACDPA